MRKNREPREPGVLRSGAYLAVIAVIAVKTLRAVLNAFTKAYSTVEESRNRRK